eukprot:TRINITY_DN40925_c0_g1_i1.p1 TRINITY_DN40925_c0_g1~~TRINITY_DN40925_c0_g1_i1.p1  ORF type:complete len:201 (+),score=58.66 TRINITY_DN40925_c0_g1_i1:812-1414(+)
MQEKRDALRAQEFSRQQLTQRSETLGSQLTDCEQEEAAEFSGRLGEQLKDEQSQEQKKREHREPEQQEAKRKGFFRMNWPGKRKEAWSAESGQPRKWWHWWGSKVLAANLEQRGQDESEVDQDETGDVAELADQEDHEGLMVVRMEQKLEQTRGQPIAMRRKIFRDLQRQLHPDKNGRCSEAAKLAFQKLMDERGWYLRE